MNKTKINKESIEQILIPTGWRNNISEEFMVHLRDANLEWMEEYKSPKGRYTLTKSTYSNLCDENGFGWNLHVDNSRMESLASCSVEYIEQIIAIMEIYKEYQIYGSGKVFM